MMTIYWEISAKHVDGSLLTEKEWEGIGECVGDYSVEGTGLDYYDKMTEYGFTTVSINAPEAIRSRLTAHSLRYPRIEITVMSTYEHNASAHEKWEIRAGVIRQFKSVTQWEEFHPVNPSTGAADVRAVHRSDIINLLVGYGFCTRSQEKDLVITGVTGCGEVVTHHVKSIGEDGKPIETKEFAKEIKRAFGDYDAEAKTLELWKNPEVRECRSLREVLDDQESYAETLEIVANDIERLVK